MKTLYFLCGLFLFASVSVFAQDYGHICSPGVTFFHTPDGTLKAFRRDSVQPLGGGDTLFFSYRTIRDNGQLWGTCYDTLHGSLLGYRIVKKQDGRFWFFNKNDDTITINSQAALDDSWKFCNIPGGHIQATVTSIIMDTILGNTDLVKVVTLQAKNSSNVNIPHILNQYTLKLSKDYGLTKMLDVYFIPDDTLVYNLAGKESPMIGVQNISWLDIFNFNVGDEFHYVQTDWWNGGVVTHSKYINTILQKYENGNSDTLIYTFQNCSQTINPGGITSRIDTIVQTYTFGNNGMYPGGEPGLPESLIPDYPGGVGFNFASRHSGYDSSYNGRLTKITEPMYFEFQSGCWQYGLFESYTKLDYTSNLGNTAYYSSAAGSYGLEIHQFNLVYFKLGSETWGTPVATDCNTLVGLEEQNTAVQPAFRVVPNPAASSFQLIFDQFDLQKTLTFRLQDGSGRFVMKGDVKNNPSTIERGSLPAGLYFLLIFDKEGLLLGKAKVIFI
jgi:hypothetical protein